MSLSLQYKYRIKSNKPAQIQDSIKMIAYYATFVVWRHLNFNIKYSLKPNKMNGSAYFIHLQQIYKFDFNKIQDWTGH